MDWFLLECDKKLGIYRSKWVQYYPVQDGAAVNEIEHGGKERYLAYGKRGNESMPGVAVYLVVNGRTITTLEEEAWVARLTAIAPEVAKILRKEQKEQSDCRRVKGDK
jgi:hypothetical protein